MKNEKGSSLLPPEKLSEFAVKFVQPGLEIPVVPDVMFRSGGVQISQCGEDVLCDNARFTDPVPYVWIAPAVIVIMAVFIGMTMVLFVFSSGSG